MTLQKTYKIYCLKHPITEEIRYIGITTNTLTNRLYQHKYNALKRKGTKVSKWIFKLLNENLNPTIELIEECTIDNWQEREIYWISYYTNLLNQHEGGKGIVIDRTYSSIERSINAHKKQIVGIDNINEIIIEFNSVKEAKEELNIKYLTTISNSLKSLGKLKGANYYWFYKEDYDNNNYQIHSKKSPVNYSKLKKVYLYSNKREYIKEYACLNLLVKELSPDKKNYTAALKAIKNNRTFKGFIISYNML